MNYLGIEIINNNILALANKIKAPNELLPVYAKRIFQQDNNSGYSVIMSDIRGYHYMIVDGEDELIHDITDNLEELLYWVFSDITASMAFEYEVKNSLEGQDYRRILYDKQLELLKIISKNFSDRKREELDMELLNKPFNDNL